MTVANVRCQICDQVFTTHWRRLDDEWGGWSCPVLCPPCEQDHKDVRANGGKRDPLPVAVARFR